MAPDKEKLESLAQTISEIKLPEVKSPEAKGVLLWAKADMENIVQELKNTKL